MNPHCHQLDRRGIRRVARASDQAVGAVGVVQDEGDARRHPALPVGDCAGQLALVGGPEGLWRVGERLEPHRAQHLFVAGSLRV